MVNLLTQWFLCIPLVFCFQEVHGAKYSRMDQVKFMKDSRWKIWIWITSNFLKAVFHKFYLIHSWILCPIYREQWHKIIAVMLRRLILWNFILISSKNKTSKKLLSHPFTFFLSWRHFSKSGEKYVLRVIKR